MRNLFDNIIFELQKAGGISVYWAELISRMQKSQDAIYFGRNSSNLLSSRLKLDELQDELYFSFLPRRYLPFLPFNRKLIEHKHIFHSSYFRYSTSPCSINITTVHDFTYEHFVSGPRLWIHAWQKRMAVKNSRGIICVSENTKRDLLNFHPWLEAEAVRVIYNGVSDAFFPIENSLARLRDFFDFWPDKPYFLFVGDRSAYKNFDAFLGLAEYFPDMALVVVGGKPYSKKERKMLECLAGGIFHFRGVTSEVLNCLYNSASCLVYPSSYEGFGIPVLEAMKAGCPVIATNASSIPEVAGNAALLVNEPTPENLAAEIRKLADPFFKSQIIEKGFAQAARFSWDKCFEETYAFYQELWNKEFES